MTRKHHFSQIFRRQTAMKKEAKASHPRSTGRLLYLKLAMTLDRLALFSCSFLNAALRLRRKELERFLVECRKTKTEIITLGNQKRR